MFEYIVFNEHKNSVYINETKSYHSVQSNVCKTMSELYRMK